MESKTELNPTTVSIPLVDKTGSGGEHCHRSDRSREQTEENENETFIDFDEMKPGLELRGSVQESGVSAVNVINTEQRESCDPVFTGRSESDYFQVSSPTNVTKHTPSSVIDGNGEFQSGANFFSGSTGLDLDVDLRVKPNDNIDAVVLNCDNRHTNPRPVLNFCSSLRDNGYLADTEHPSYTAACSYRYTTSGDGSNPGVYHASKRSKFSYFVSKFEDVDAEDEGCGDEDAVSVDSWLEDGSVGHSRRTAIQAIARAEFAPLSQPAPGVDGGDDAGVSARFLPGGLPGERSRRSLTPLGLFRIRQSGLVQRTVTLTYLLTFLYLLACLLQLYTALGVYGVLASRSRVPAPWPWLAFHAIYRVTEVAILTTTIAIAFCSLTQRTRGRRQQQHQQHQQQHHHHHHHQQQHQQQQPQSLQSYLEEERTQEDVLRTIVV
ncbi:hypothetical protein EGW08_001998 [Elysia chlorotica]|uniref:Proline-rich transmembrane protein 3/4 domain-containing protein n=1 Tax=Elysia chlorotica TaxID=188477 RepID=A0A433U8S7_ELYCH|nr:hypothetical protein EGW08_001998 [Elysia chlorotica]